MSSVCRSARASQAEKVTAKKTAASNWKDFIKVLYTAKLFLSIADGADGTSQVMLVFWSRSTMLFYPFSLIPPAPSPLLPTTKVWSRSGLTPAFLDGAVPCDDHPVLRETARQLGAYFVRDLREFDLPLVMKGTPFQLRVWQALCCIPYGETRSYAEQARAIGAPDAIRAVGAANGRNPIPIVVPCHRVIGSNGKLTGFGGGLPLKRWLRYLKQPAVGVVG